MNQRTHQGGPASRAWALCQASGAAADGTDRLALLVAPAVRVGTDSERLIVPEKT